MALWATSWHEIVLLRYEYSSNVLGFFWAGSSDIFCFCPSSKGRGWGGGSEGRGNFSKIRGKKGEKRGGGGGVDAGKGSGALLGGGGVLNIYFEG